MGMELYAHEIEVNEKGYFDIAKDIDCPCLTTNLRNVFISVGVNFLEETKEDGCIRVSPERATKMIEELNSLIRHFSLDAGEFHNNKDRIYIKDWLTKAVAGGYTISMC